MNSDCDPFRGGGRVLNRADCDERAPGALGSQSPAGDSAAVPSGVPAIAGSPYYGAGFDRASCDAASGEGASHDGASFDGPSFGGTPLDAPSFGRSAFDTPSFGRSADDFVSRVLAVVEAIPIGRVMTYGEVAAAVGSRAARAVGQTMAHYGSDLAWWRVIRASGQPAVDHESQALEHFRAEGTPLKWSPSGIFRVDLARARWRP